MNKLLTSICFVMVSSFAFVHQSASLKIEVLNFGHVKGKVIVNLQ